MSRKEAASVPRFAPFPVHVPVGFDGKSIRCITNHNGKIFVAVEGRKIWPLEITKNPDDPLDISFTCQGGKLIKVEGMEICEMQSSGDLLFFIVRPAPDKPGPLLVMGKDSKIMQLAQKVDHFSVNVSSLDKVFVYTEGCKVVEKKLVKTEGSETWKPIKDFTFDCPCLGVALSYPHLLVACENTLVEIDLNEVQRGMKIDIEATKRAKSLVRGIRTEAIGSFKANPKLLATPKKKLYAYSDTEQQSYLLEMNLSSDATIVKFPTPQLEHAVSSNGLMFCSVGDDTVNTFAFGGAGSKERTTMSEAFVRGVKHVASFGESSFMVANGTQLFAFWEITNPFNLASEGKVKEAVAWLQARTKMKLVMAVIMLFEQLWNSDKIGQALEVMKLKEFEPALLDVFPLFTFLTLTIDQEKRRELQCRPVTDQSVAKHLAETLSAVRQRHPDEVIKTWVDTALFQIYAMQEDIPKLVALINDIPRLSDESMTQFFDGKESTPCAMYLNYIGKTKEAMEVFHHLTNFDAVVFEEITRVMISNAKEWPFIRDNIVWLAERSPERACKVLSCEYISVGDAIPFCKKCDDLKNYYPRVLYGTLFRRSLLNRADLVTEYIRTVIGILIDLRQPNFDRTRVAFCSCVIENPNASDDLIEDELGTNFIEVMRKFANDIKASTLVSFVDKISVKKVQVEIYRATGNVQEAINRLWDGGSRQGIDACEQFCRENSDPAAAFQVLIRQMESNLPADKKMQELRRLLSENMSVIDISSALATFDSNQRLEDIAEFLEKSYRRLVAMRKDAELDAAFAQSNKFESEYQRTRYECQCIELTSESKCARCHRDVNYKCVQRAPNGMLYHLQCMKDDQ